MVKPGFELSLDQSLDSEGKGLLRILTEAYNLPNRGSVSDPCPVLGQPTKYTIIQIQPNIIPADDIITT